MPTGVARGQNPSNLHDATRAAAAAREPWPAWVSWTATVLLLLFGLAQFAHRSPPVKKGAFFFDFSNVYAASRVWLTGGDPFDINQAYDRWERSGHGRYFGAPPGEP